MTATTPGSALVAGLGAGPVEPSLDQLTAIVTTLAGDTYAGRRIGSPGSRAAGAWLAGHLAALGATVAVDELPAGVVRDLYATPTLTWHDGNITHDLTHRRDFAEHLASADLPTPRVGALGVVGNAALTGRWILAPVYTAELVNLALTAGAAGLLVHEGPTPTAGCQR